MKKKAIIFLITLIFFSGIGYFTYNYFMQPVTGGIRSIYLVPKDAIYFIKTNEPIANWDEISNSEPWKFLQTNNFIAELSASINSLDSTIKDNQKIFSALGSRELIVSAHLYKKDDYDFLYIIDLQNFSLVQSFIDQLVTDDYVLTKRDFKEVEINELFDKTSRETFYFAFIENHLVASYSHVLVEASIEEKQLPEIGRDIHFIPIQKSMQDDSKMQLFLQYRYLDDFMYCYLDEKNETLDGITESLFYTGLELELDPASNLISLDGISNIDPEVVSYLSAMINSGKGNRASSRVIPFRTGFWLSLGFEDFSRFKSELETIMKKDSVSFNEYQANISRIEKFLNISVEDDFISWINNEISFVQTSPYFKELGEEFSVLVKTKDISVAREKLNGIKQQIKKRTPVKFKTLVYNGYEINYLSIKGFFKALLGGVFAKLEKPYYIFLEDYVVFSNNPQALMSIIDDYEQGKVLETDASYQKIADRFETDNNLFLYINPPLMTGTIKGFLDSETSRDYSANKDYFDCFSPIGFQFTENDHFFDTKICASFLGKREIIKSRLDFNSIISDTRNSLLHSTIENTDTILSDTVPIDPFFVPHFLLPDLTVKKYVTYHENENIHIEAELDEGIKDGSYKEYYPNGELKIKGKFDEGLKQGVWKRFDKEGNIVEKIKYEGGEIKN